MRFFFKYFLRGVLIVVPLAATVWILSTVFNWIDTLLGNELAWRVPGTTFEVKRGVGFLLLVALVTCVGLLTSSVIVRYFVTLIDDVFRRVPVVKLVYTAVKDMIEAFVSERKKFDKPVLLAFAESPDIEVIGFVTRDTLDEFGRPDKVAVYVPQSYNFAANLILVPRERVTPIELPAADVMTFVVSGGVSEGTRRDSEDVAKDKKEKKDKKDGKD